MKLLIVAGARPNFMKVAPLIKAVQAHNVGAAASKPKIEWRLVHTGQHYDAAMSDIFFGELGIPAPAINLGVGSGTQGVQTANVMTKFEPVCEMERPDWVIVVGDVNSTMACALVAAKLGIKVAHVEAGLRSFDRTMPEEINRLVTDALADLLLTPSSDADENLKREGIPESKIRLVGNVMIDTLVANLESARKSKMLEVCGVQSEAFAYVTLHRPSNVDDPTSLATIMGELSRLATQMPVVFPMHPRTRKMCSQFGISCSRNNGLRLLEPIGYQDSICLTENARFVLTDSGGLQEESSYFKTPCLTLRPNTERPITITMGSNKLTRLQTLPADIDEVLRRAPRFGNVPSLWDGQTAGRIVKALFEKHDSPTGNKAVTAHNAATKGKAREPAMRSC
jgi:UDP-N-acetylglucosamine 2-epimerase (non-hydrolysing)